MIVDKLCYLNNIVLKSFYSYPPSGKVLTQVQTQDYIVIYQDFFYFFRLEFRDDVKTSRAPAFL